MSLRSQREQVLDALRLGAGHLVEISYKQANDLLFINRELFNTPTFLGAIGACWKTRELRKEMCRSQLFFSPTPFIFGGHQVVMKTPEGRVYYLETADAKVKKFLDAVKK